MQTRIRVREGRLAHDPLELRWQRGVARVGQERDALEPVALLRDHRDEGVGGSWRAPDDRAVVGAEHRLCAAGCCCERSAEFDLVEGSVSAPSQQDELVSIRAHAKKPVTIGA
jgi:hypothetical protein